MFKYVMISVAYDGGFGDATRLEGIVKMLSKDWARTSFTNWVLWTDKSTITIGEMMRDYLGANDQFVVAVIDRTSPVGGWLPMWFWEWFNKDRDVNTGEEINVPDISAAIASFLTDQK